MSEHTPNNLTAADGGAQTEVFELQETPTPQSGSVLGGILRFGLYSFAAVLLGGLVAIQVNPELGDYLASLPGMSQLAGDDGSSCHVCPMSQNASQVATCPSSCESACSSQMVATGCCSASSNDALAVRPPAPPIAESLELTSTEL